MSHDIHSAEVVNHTGAMAYHCAPGDWEASCALESLSLSDSKQDLNKALRHYHNAKAAIPTGKATEAREIMQTVSQDLLKYFKENDSRICQLYYAGSAYDGVLVANSPNNDFDIPVAIDGRKNVIIDDVIPGHVRISPTISDDSYFKRFLDDEGYVLTKKIQESKMFSLVQKAADFLNRMYRDIFIDPPILNGPAIQLNIVRGGRKISVDLVPAIKMSETERYVAKSFKIFEDEPRLPRGVDSNTLWRRSYSVEEKNLFSTIDADGGCRKQLLHILKAMRNEDPTLKGLTSYHLKTLLLHENKKLGSQCDWAQDKLGERFMGLLDSLKQSLGGTLPNYFIPEVDLYNGMSSIKRENIQGRVKRLINSQQELSKVLQTDYKGPPGMCTY